MPFRITTKLVYDEARLAKVRRAFRQLGVSGFRDSIDMPGLGRRALSFLRKVFPRRPGASPSDSGRSSASDFKQRLRDGWDVETSLGFSGASIAAGNRGEPFSIHAEFSLYHRLAEKSYRVARVLSMLDKGTGSYSYTIKSPAVFKGRIQAKSRNKLGQFTGTRSLVSMWTTLREGRTITVSGRSGHNYTDKTENFIRLVLLPEVRRRVENRAKKLF